MTTCIFSIKCMRDKRIKREIEVPQNWNLYKLAGAIVGSFEFDFDHAFGFFSNITAGYNILQSERKYELFADLEDQGIEPVDSGSVKKTKIGEVWKMPGDKMMMLFDYGDEWRFIVEFKGVGVFSKDAKHPRLLKQVGKAPRQYD